jgi:hypothetical protein
MSNVSKTRLRLISDYCKINGKEKTLKQFNISQKTLKRYLTKARSTGIEDNAEEMNLDHKDVKHGWIKTKNASYFFKNPEFTETEFDLDNIDWGAILEPLNIQIKPPVKWSDELTGKFDRVVYTDTHIGMTPNENGFSLYGGKWDESELMKRLNQMVQFILDNQNSNTLVLDDLGDLMDGWNAHTVRRQHPLPQNMDDQKAFDVALSFKVGMIDMLSDHYCDIIVHNVCNDNHSGAFGYVVNSAFKKICELKHENVIVDNYRKFINHYNIDRNVFILTHGKDDKHLKFGFKPKLDPQQEAKIKNYIDENFLRTQYNVIEFSKGDSHQFLLDFSSSDSFNYFSFPAFSPSSEWVQTNFQKGISGLVMFNYFDTKNFSIKPLLFDWNNS